MSTAILLTSARPTAWTLGAPRGELRNRRAAMERYGAA